MLSLVIKHTEIVQGNTPEAVAVASELVVPKRSRYRALSAASGKRIDVS